MKSIDLSDSPWPRAWRRLCSSAPSPDDRARHAGCARDPAAPKRPPSQAGGQDRPQGRGSRQRDEERLRQAHRRRPRRHRQRQLRRRGAEESAQAGLHGVVSRRPNKFRHESKDGLLVGSTGDKLYIYSPTENVYSTLDSKGDKLEQVPQPLANILFGENPSLLMAISLDPFWVFEGATVNRGDDTHDRRQEYATLRITDRPTDESRSRWTTTRSSSAG
jgi:hypothetical protein